MATTIAIGGKGGSGKTTLAAMIVRLLLSREGKGTILAVDADPNSCLASMLGVQPVGTIADIREDARAKSPGSAGGDRLRSLEYGIQQAITEADGFDLLVMGRPEGPGCYCAVNNMLRKFLDQLSSRYQFVIIDNEAGMEHLSRRATNNVDILCIVAEPTPLGVLTAGRIFELAKKLPLSVKEIGVIWNNNRVDVACSDIDKFEIPQLGCVPFDKAVFDALMKGKTVFDLEDNTPALLAVSGILDRRLNAEAE
ncbi:MAG: carbon monoxide dehydrogenase [Planctomycetota bacterium]|nr:carbon monoxide dehydrogenase [Planctomycetota bacterium]